MAASVSDQLAWESKAGRAAAAAAALSAVCFVAGGAYLQIASQRRSASSNELLAAIGRQPADYLIAGVVSALAFLLLGMMLAYLYRTARFRRENLPTAAIVLTVFGALGAAAVALGRPIDLAAAAGDLPSGALRSGESTDAALRERTSLQIIGILGLASNLALAFALILISLNSMRAGLLSRFLGVLVIVIGVLLPFLGAMPVLLFFWLCALAALFVDRWPGGRGPAWATGRAIPWPGMAERNAELDRRHAAADVGEDEYGAGTAGPIEPQGERDPAGGALATGAGNGGPPAGTRAKRKRGRRR